jgi:hypothetical protein
MGRDGLVEAMSTESAMPGDGERVEGESLYVWRGLVEADGDEELT